MQDTATKNILVVDDEQVMREFLADVLEDFNVVKAADGDEAIEKLKTDRYDLIITDMKMPRVSGEEVVKFAKETYPDSKIIVISGYSSLFSVSNTLGYGVCAFLSKPFTIKQIRSEVEKSLGLGVNGPDGLELGNGI
ncbi:MAG TPA: response regulator [candidate division Zixibacteria bacterium]|nr:response regulator [candidate division Zixibacteria bacterium]